MAKRAASIRRGFDYQDLYCLDRLLSELEANSLESEFTIDSDETDFIDDLVIYAPAGRIEGYQVKYHVNMGELESFASLTHRRTARSRSILEKLHVGWSRAINHGRVDCTVHFVTNRAAEPGPKRLGSAIDGASKQMSSLFLEEPGYAEARKDWLSALGVSITDLRDFLANVRWKMGHLSIEELRESSRDRLRRLGLPYHPDAVAVAATAIGHFATDVEKRSSLREFVMNLASYPCFREACESAFGAIGDGARSNRASSATIACVQLALLPSFQSTKFSCIEEPLPLESYDKGVSRPELAGVLDVERGRWAAEYRKWNKARVTAILAALEAEPIDILVLPRFSVELELAGDLYAWATKKGCNVILGGIPLATTPRGLEEVLETLNLRAPTPVDLEIDDIVDVVIRPDRAGRAIVLRAETPYAKKEQVRGDVELVECSTSSGWLTVAPLGSVSAVDAYRNRGTSRPDLVVASCGIHSDLIMDRLESTESLTGVPEVIVSMRSVQPVIQLIDGKARGRAYPADWEGATIVRLEFDRDPGGVRCRVGGTRHIPLAYSDSLPNSGLGSASPGARGARGSDLKVSAAVAITAGVESPAALFLRRGLEAVDCLRKKLGSLPLGLATEAIESVGVLEGAVDDAKRRANVVTFASANSGRRHDEANQTSPPFVNRSNELALISRYLDGATKKRLLILHGSSGIGKRALVENALRTARVSPESQWIRCAPDVSFDEFIGQVASTFGALGTEVPSADNTVYAQLMGAVLASKKKVVVIEGGQNLPVNRDHKDHPRFKALIEVLCGDASGALWIVISDTKVDIAGFSGSHRVDRIEVAPLTAPDMLRLVRELFASLGRPLPAVGAEELERLVGALHGYPVLARLAVDVADSDGVSGFLTNIHGRAEVRTFVVSGLLGLAELSKGEEEVLKLLGIVRIPVETGAIAKLVGAHARSIVERLRNRVLVEQRPSGRVCIHPLIGQHFASRIEDVAEERRLHRVAAGYYEQLVKGKSRGIDEQLELVYHSMRGGLSIPLAAMQLFSGGIRSALIDAVREREYESVRELAQRVLEIVPRDAVANTAGAIAAEALGHELPLEAYAEDVIDLDPPHAWLAVELAKCMIRRRAFERTEALLNVLESAHGVRSETLTARAQLRDRAGDVEEAVVLCERVLADHRTREREAFHAGLILRRAGRSDILVRAVEARWGGRPNDERLIRAFSHACVITGTEVQPALHRLRWLAEANKQDGYAQADYGSALAQQGEWGQAERVFRRALSRVGGRWSQRAAVLEEYAQFASQRKDYGTANEQYETLIKRRPHELHVLRRYARSLIEESREVRTQGMQGVEQRCLDRARDILQRVLEHAPSDDWALRTLDGLGDYS